MLLFRRSLLRGGRPSLLRTALIAVLPLFFLAVPLRAAVIYVSTSAGSDANSGLLSSAPKATLTAAYAAASAGDTIKIASGVYNESLDSIAKSLSFEGAYSADFLSRDYAVLRSTVAGRFNVNNGGLVLSFDGLAVSSDTATPFYLYWGMAAASTVTISNSVIFNSSAPAIDTYGSQYYTLIVASNTIYNCRAGVALGPATYRTALIHNNVISEIREFGGTINDGKAGVAIDVQGYGPLTISSNTVNRAEMFGIDAYNGSSGAVIEKNVFSDCGSGGAGGYSNGGIRFGSGVVQIRNNLLLNCRFSALILGYSNAGAVIANNTIIGPNTDFAIENGSGALFKNNIILNLWTGFSGTDVDTTEIAHNIFGNLGIDRIQHGLYDFWEAGLSFLTPTLHDNILVPTASTSTLFVDAAAGDYRLAANSIAADAGDPDDDPGAEPGGGRIDCGAYGGLAQAPASENVPPAAVADLAASPGANVGELELAWSAPGDDGAANRNVYGAYYELRYATYSVSGYTQAQWWAAAGTYIPQTAWIVAEDTSVTKSLEVANLTAQPMGAPGFAERHSLVGLEAGVTYYFMLKTTDNSGNVSDPDANSAAAGTMASAPAQGAGNHAPVLGHTADNFLGPVSHTTDGTNLVGVKFRVKDPDGAADTSTIAVRSDQYYTYGPQFRVDGGTWDDIELQDVSFSASPFVPAADFSGTEYTLTWATTMTVTGAESSAAELRFKISDGSSESLWASTGPFMLDNKKPSNPAGAPTYRWPVSLKFNWGQSTDINFTDYRVVYATYSFGQCYAAEANLEWTSAGDPALAVRQTTFTVLTGLIPGVTYWYYVEARDSYGHRSSGSNCIGFSTVTLGDYGAPGAITDLAASPTPGNSGGITLEWTVPGGDGASGDMTDAQYLIKYSSLGIITAASFDSPPQPHYTLTIPTNTAAGQKNRALFAGLAPGTSYWFAIKVKDSAELWNVWNSSQDVPSDNTQAFARAKDYGTDPPLGVFSGNFSLTGGAVYDGTGPDEAWALAVDTVTAGGPFVYAVGVSSTGGGFAPQDFMMIKYDASGSKVLSRYYHNYFGDTAYAAAVDHAGNLYVTGQTASGSGDWLTLKFDPKLDLLASAKYNGPDGRSDTPRALAIDPAGDIIVAGNSYDAANHPDYVTLKYAQDLSVVLATAVYDGGGNEEARAAAVDAAGNIVVTGGNGADFFTIKYDNDLAVLSSAAFNGSGSSGDTAYGVGTDAAGNIFVTGSEWGASGWANYLTLKYSPDLSVVLASASFNGPAGNNDYAYALAVDTAGYILVTGASRNSSGNDDIVTLKYGPALALIHSDSYDSGLADAGRAVAAGPGGYTYVAGASGSYPGYDQRLLRRVMADVAPPAGVTDLAAQTGTGVTGEIRLSWTAPGDDGAAWNISGGGYEIKYSSVAIITAANYGAPPAPSQTLTIDTNTVPGQSVSYIISGLLPGTSYWFALKTRDESGNWSVWSSSHDSPGDNTGAYAMAKRPGNDPPLGVFSGDFSQAGGAAYDGTGTDQAYGVAVDTFSPGGPYVYVVGISSITGGFAPYDWLVVKYDSQGGKLISQRLGGPNGWNDYARAAAVDPWGNLVVAGYIMTPSQDNMLTVKFDQNLDILSSATYNGPANSWDEAYGVAVDASGNIFVAGQSRTSNYDFFTIKYSPSLVALASATYNAGGDEQANAVAVNSAGEVIVAGTRNSDFFTIKYSADLAVLSSAAVANTDAANAVAVDPDGNIIVAGEEWGGAALENFRVVKYDPTLTSVLVSTAINGPGNGNDYPYGVAADTSSNILVSGKSQSGANYNIFTLKLDPNLSLIISSASYNGGGDDIGRAVAAGGSGYVYTAGHSANGSNDDFRALRHQFPDLPPPPVLAASAAGVSSITWSWNDVNLGETGYLLIASTGGPISGVLAANAVSWPETGLSTNTAYSRSVVALNMPGVSTSAAFTVWTAAAPPADAAAAALSSTSISVTWSANGNPAGTDFEVSWSSADAFLTGGAISTAPVTETYSAALTGLQAYTTYYVRVRAYNGDSVPTDFAVAPSTRTHAPPPDAAFVSQSVPASMKTGVSYSVSVTMRNTSLLPWTKAAQYRLGSQNPQDNQRWGSGRVDLDDADSIGPGQEKTFTFNVTAPLQPGTTDFQWRMIQEGVQWFGGLSENFSVAVASNAAEFVFMSVPETMVSGRSYKAKVIFRNTGDTTWTKAANYRLGSQDPQDNTVWLGSTNRVELADSNSVPPGANATYYFTITAPAAGTRAFQWRMLQEFTQWFPQAAAVTPSVAIEVAPALSPDRKAYVPGDTPLYSITGAPPDTAILWSSWKDGAQVQNSQDLGQTTDGAGSWTGAGPAFAPGDAGFWRRQASVGGLAAEARYNVAASLTAAVPSTAAWSLGVSHVAGDYRLTSEPFLAEGAKLAANLNPNVVFVYMTPEYSSRDYPATDFGAAKSDLTQLAQSAPYQDLFSMPFSTYVITAYSFGTYGWVNSTPRSAMTPAQTAAETAEMYSLARHLLQTYQGSGKTFILKNWEGDWAMNEDFDTYNVPDSTRIAAATGWLNARHAGVVQARSELAGLPGVRVADAVEFNLLDRARQDVPCLLRDVAPSVESDYLSYSSWESVNSTDAAHLRDRLLEDISFARAHPAAQGRDLIISEYGFKEDLYPDSGARTAIAGQAFLDAAVPLAFYWEILDNECQNDQPGPPGACAGYGLLRQDGARAPAWSALRGLLGAQNGAAYIGQSVPLSMRPGEVREVSVTLRNDGNRAWDSANGYKLASSNPENNSTWGLNRVELSSSSAVPPGASKTWTFAAAAPASTGSYNFQWRMAQEGLETFGAASAGVQVLIADAPPPQPVLSGAALGVSSIAWSWGDVDAEDGYRVLASTGGVLASAAAGGLAWEETALSTNTAYTRLVEVFNAAGASTSTPRTRFTLAAPPSGAAALALSSISIGVSWEANGNPGGTDFEISYSSADAFLTGGAISTAPLTQAYALTLTSLLPYTTYYVRVRAYNGDGAPTDLSVPPSTRTNAPAPAAPALAGAVHGVSSITWTWADVQYENGYRLKASTGGPVSGTLPAGTVSWTELGLSTNTGYSRYLEAFNASGSSETVPLTRWTPAAPPSGLIFQEAFISSVSLSWSGNTNPPWTDYSVSLWVAGGSTATVTSSATTVSFTGLDPGTTYYAAVLAVNGAGLPSSQIFSASTVTAKDEATGLITPGGGGTVSYSGPSGEIRLEMPPGAFAAPVNVTIQPPASLPEGRAAEQNLAPVGVGAEIVPDAAVQPTLDSLLTFNYTDADAAGLDENALLVARYEPASGSWLRLPSTPDPALNRVTARLNHFSLYQLMAYLPAQAVSQARVYPNPCRGQDACREVMISRAMPGAKIRIYSLSGELVRGLTADGLGTAVWDTRNKSGGKAASGVYFILVKGGGTKTLKLAIIR